MPEDPIITARNLTSKSSQPASLERQVAVSKTCHIILHSKDIKTSLKYLLKDLGHVCVLSDLPSNPYSLDSVLIKDYDLILVDVRVTDQLNWYAKLCVSHIDEFDTVCYHHKRQKPLRETDWMKALNTSGCFTDFPDVRAFQSADELISSLTKIDILAPIGLLKYLWNKVRRFLPFLLSTSGTR